MAETGQSPFDCGGIARVLRGLSFSSIDGAKAQSKPELASGPAASPTAGAVSGNPAATTFTTGTGWLGRQLGLRDEWGVTLGGVWLADTNLVAAGGAQPGGWTNNSALFIGLGIDAEKLVGWSGASFGVQFLQLNAGNTNGQAGTCRATTASSARRRRTAPSSSSLVCAGDDQGRAEDPHWPREPRRGLQQRPAPHRAFVDSTRTFRRSAASSTRRSSPMARCLAPCPATTTRAMA